MGLAAELTDPIETDRLVLAPLREDDADEMVTVLASPVLYRFTGGEPPTLPDLRRRYAAMVTGRSPDGRQEWLNWVVRRRSDSRAVGTVQATVPTGGGPAEVAWVVDVREHGHGYAAEAAHAMIRTLVEAGVPGVVAHIHPDHAASEAVARRCGLTATEVFHEGERRWESDGGSFRDTDTRGGAT